MCVCVSLPSNHLSCISPMYTHTHTHTHRYKSGLLALNGLLCLHESSEAELAARFGSDAGVAFCLLGELNARLKQTKQAVSFFRAALKYNPFLWSAFQSLCELGECVCVFESLSKLKCRNKCKICV